MNGINTDTLQAKLNEQSFRAETMRPSDMTRCDSEIFLLNDNTLQ